MCAFEHHHTKVVEAQLFFFYFHILSLIYFLSIIDTKNLKSKGKEKNSMLEATHSRKMTNSENLREICMDEIADFSTQ